MIDRHLLVLLVVIPLCGAPLVLLVRHRVAAYGVALAVAGTVAALAARIVVRVLSEGTLSYALGGWVPPWGIQYRVDYLGALMVAVVATVGLAGLVFAPRSIAHEIPRERHYLFYTLYLLCLTGLLGISVTGDLFNLFVFLEIASLSGYVLVGLGPTRRALTAAFQYLVLGTLGATFILIGIGLLYQITGTLNMMDMARLLPGTGRTRTVMVALAFFTAGLSLKAAIFPLHLWLPNAYTYAPSVASAFLAGTSTKVALYVLLRLIFSVFGHALALEWVPLHAILTIMGSFAIVVASAVAIFQADVKRLLAYSSVAQVGYVVLGLTLHSLNGLTAAIIHLANHAFTKSGMFLAMGCMAARLGTTDLARLRGVGRRMPITTAAWVVGGLGLIGVPATAGFITKWYLVSAALQAGSWMLVVLIAASSLLAVAYVWRVVEVAYFRAPDDAGAGTREAPPVMLIATWLLIGLTLYLGIFAAGPVGFARHAAEVLLRTAP